MAEIMEAILGEPAQTETVAWSKPSPPPTKLTWEQASKLAQGKPFELINGRMKFKMSDNKHADAQIRLGAKLVEYFDRNPIGLARTEYTFRLWPDRPHEGRVPDLCAILNQNVNEERYGSAAPDLAIEIVSRDDGWTELYDKAELYFEHGSRIVWFVDPMQKGVMVVTPQDRKWVKDTLTCPELLPDFAINVQDIFVWPSIAKQNIETK